MIPPSLPWTRSAETNRVPSLPGDRSFPPWGSPGRWLWINQRIDGILREPRNRTKQMRRSAKAVDDSLRLLFPLMDDLCAATCRFCPSPCCFTARVYFDLQDLLFHHLMGFGAPPHQPIRHPQSTCLYLGPGGCRLPRRRRPWICAWYLCPTQTSRIRGRKGRHGPDILALIDQIGRERKRMAAFFTLL